ncbi:ABC transporter ATP-binding protein [Parendozoicomonas haliclonae]|uniref:Macrolide export ATP-binding/permease protein MacB n=1 Tax=Parendozoicomonas haliclonae TaxID=1960125 RepID=A0A1X7APN6_9GAMM|nr:ABC transporter ATP-binding protein [Parendozoicomonas haliclonae]SMA50215.1 Macrolide export ATP-binding/permease protein MacB [Parendozoicomonas haliclonae]
MSHTEIPAISCKQLSHSFPMGEEPFQVLKDIDLTIRTGEMVAIMGPSGSGKSTLMNLIGCLMTPEQGEVCLLENSTRGMDRAQLACLRRDHIGFVFQQFNLLARTSALDNVKMPLMYADNVVKDGDERARRCLESVNLADRQNHTPSQLSGGQQQRVAIARALINEPSILLADEPTGALDSKTSEDIMALFRDLNRQGKTVVLVTHELDVAQQCDRIIFVRDGVIQSDKSVISHREEVTP